MTFKPVLYIVLIGSFLWGMVVLPVWGHYFNLLKLMLAVSMWGYVVVTAADIAASWWAKPTPYLQSFYKTLANDLIVALVSGAVIASIYHFSKAHYEASSFDIAAAAIPFAPMTLATILAMAKAKVANRSMKRRFVVLLILITLLACSCIYSTVLKIASNQFSLPASTWLQLTILFFALFSYVETRRMLYMLEEGRFEPSPFLMSLFGPNGPYGQLQEVAELWNANVAKERENAHRASRERADKKNKAKKKRKKRGLR